MIRGRQAIQINLHDGGVNALETELLAPRVNATTLAELETHYWEFTQFISYLAHVGGFILPLALGDTYFALGDYGRASMYYIKVRDYRFLNQTIEKPVIWNKLAHTYLQWGNRLYRDQNITDARSQYEKIVKIVNGAFELSGSLYEGGFSTLMDQTLAFLESADRLTFDQIEYNRRVLILDALGKRNEILNGINYLGFPENIIPIQSWRYLQNAADILPIKQSKPNGHILISKITRAGGIFPPNVGTSS